jgi:hypothetical protein
MCDDDLNTFRAGLIAGWSDAHFGNRAFKVVLYWTIGLGSIAGAVGAFLS